MPRPSLARALADPAVDVDPPTGVCAGIDIDAATDAVLSASRALVAIAARSIAGVADDVTLPQYRALVVLAARGQQTVGALAESLGVAPSTATRLCDRLVAKRLILRGPSPESRREVVVSLAARGRRLVDAVTARRRAELATVVARLPGAERAAVADALRAFAAAAGEVPESAWALGFAPA